MSIVKFAPRERDILGDIFSAQKEMSKMLSNLWNDDSELSNFGSWFPSVDISESKEEFTVKVELPGINKNDVKITLQENVLTIQGEKKQETESKERNYHRVERSYGSFSRSFRFPSMVKADKIDANYKDGVLTISLPKAEEAKAKEIDVKF